MYLIFIILIPALCIGQGRDHFGWLPFDQKVRSDYCRGVRPSALDDSMHQYDALKFWSYLNINLDGGQVSGSARLQIVADEIVLTTCDLRLVSGMTVDSSSSTTHTVDSVGRRGVDSLQVYLSPPLQIGDTADFTIYYHGSPNLIDPWGGMFFDQEQNWQPQICYTLGEGLALEPPPANYDWLPCFADPNDKVLWESWMQVPEGLTAVGPGARLPEVNNGDGTVTWHYRIDQEIPTYLAFVSVSDYQIMTQRESNPVIENFVYPSRWNQAQVHFQTVPTCLDSFAANFGPYVFDRFGYNMARNGDMEHATSVTHYDGAVVANRSWDWILFHEMAHHWWGDWVTIADWRDLWLNEGFATYCEALGMEWVNGEQSFRNYMRTDLQPAARGAGNESTIYDPDFYWGAIVYEKGGCVMHMLRWVMGDSLFFAALRDYGQQFAFANATTADFQTVCESHYDSTLEWFFDEWVFDGTGYPQYDVELENTDIVALRINQIQTGTRFTMPVEVEYWAENQLVEVDTIWVGEDEYFDMPQHYADSAKFDPKGWLLKTATYHVLPADELPQLPQDFKITSAYPNPFNPALTIAYESPRAQQITLKAFNIQGQLVHEYRATAHGGTNYLTWDASESASGIYLIQLSTQTEVRTAKAVLLK